MAAYTAAGSPSGMPSRTETCILSCCSMLCSTLPHVNGKPMARPMWQVVEWMASAGIKPNVRTYTALITALGNASEWDRALGLLRRMRACSAPGGVEPNAYTYSALIKALGEQVFFPLQTLLVTKRCSVLLQNQ